jgi:GNAT superfamily N-acetyltransferase
LATERLNSKIDLSESVALRPATPEDEAFLRKVYASTRADEMAATGWLDVEQQVFINMQFKLQHQGYRAQFPNADHDIILFDGQPVGRLMVDRASDEIRCVSIAILPEHRNRGIGTLLLQNLSHEAIAAGKPFRLQVEVFNPAAYRLYERLGFVKTGESGAHFSMEWQPDSRRV